MSADGTPAGADQTGELIISGAGVSPGYLGRADLDAVAFVDEHGVRAFRTGDFVRQDGDGRLTFVERRDGQVKIRGYRVELGDVETALRSCVGVAQASAVVTEGESPSVVGFVIADAGTVLDPGVVIAAAAAIVPTYMVPQRVVVVPAFPLTGNGKVDRRALAAQASALPQSEPQLQPELQPTIDQSPDGVIEQMLAAVWASVLGCPTPALHDDFFALGGDSLAATRIVARVSETFGVVLGVAEIFQNPTVSDLALSVMGALITDEELALAIDDGVERA